MDKVRNFFKQTFCRHSWVAKRTPLVLEETGEYCGIIVEETCKKCNRKHLRVAV